MNTYFNSNTRKPKYFEQKPDLFFYIRCRPSALNGDVQMLKKVNDKSTCVGELGTCEELKRGIGEL